jgi:hypothetical protein
MTNKKQDDILQKSITHFSNTVKDYLRSYLFNITIDKDVNVTLIVRNIKWTAHEMTIDTMVDENAEIFKQLLKTSRLNVHFLNRGGTPVMTESFYINGLKTKYPLEISHESEPSMLQYRLVFEYTRFG